MLSPEHTRLCLCQQEAANHWWCFAHRGLLVQVQVRQMRKEKVIVISNDFYEK